MATRRIPRTYQRSSDQLVAAITTVPLCSALIPKQKPRTESPLGERLSEYRVCLPGLS